MCCARRTVLASAKTKNLNIQCMHVFFSHKYIYISGNKHFCPFMLYVLICMLLHGSNATDLI